MSAGGIVILSLFALIIIVLLVLEMQSVIFRRFQLPRMARQHKWKHENPRKELTKRHMHMLWASTGELPRQELTRVEGTYRGYEFNFAIVESPIMSRNDVGKELRRITTSAAIVVRTPLLPPEFEKWYRKNHGRVPVLVGSKRLRSSLDGSVSRRKFIRRLDQMVDIIEGWTSNGDKRRTT